MNSVASSRLARSSIKSRLRLGAATLGLAALASGAADAAPAVFFTDDLEYGETLFNQTVASASPDAILFTYDFTSGSAANFSVTGSDDETTVYVRSSLAGSPAMYSGTFGGDGGFQQWGVSYNAADGFDAVVDAGYTLEFFADSEYTTEFDINAVGLQTWDWGTCCTTTNTTPDGTAAGSAIYMMFDPDGDRSNNFIGNITTSIASTTHFVAAIDDRNSFSSMTLAPNGSGEAFGAGGHLMFTFVPIGSVPEDSSYVDVGDTIPDIDNDGPYTTDELNDGDVNPVFDGGVLELTGGGQVTSNFDVKSTSGGVNTNGDDSEFTGTFSGTGAITKLGEGVMTLSGVNTFTGGLVMQEGAVSVSGDSALGGAGGPLGFDGGALKTTASFATSRVTTIIGGGGEFDTAEGTVLTHAGVINGNGRLVKTGAGGLALAGAKDFTGGVDILEGALIVGTDSALGGEEGDIFINGGVFNTIATVLTRRDTAIGSEGGTFSTDANSSLIHEGTMTGAGRVFKTGSGDLFLTGENTFEGGVGVRGGKVVVGADSALGAAEGDVSLDGGALAAGESFSTARAFTLGEGNGGLEAMAGKTLTVTGDIGGVGGLIKTGQGTLALSGAKDFTGGVFIYDGDVVVGADGELGGEAGGLTLDGGALTVSHSFATSRNTVVGPNDGEFSVAAGQTFTHNGEVSGLGSLVKSGAGSMALNGDGQFASVTVLEGDLYIHSNQMLSAMYDIMEGGVLLGRGNLAGDVNVHSGGVLSPGASPGTMTVGGDVTLSDGSSFVVEIDGYGTGSGAGNHDRLILVGADSLFTADGSIEPVLRGITGDADNDFTPQVGDTFTVVASEGGVEGTFDTLVQPSAGMLANTRFEVLYGDDTVRLFVMPIEFTTMVDPYARGNGKRVAEALDSVRSLDGSGPNDDATSLFRDFYGMDSQNIAVGLSQLAGEMHANTLVSARRGSRIVRDGFMFDGATGSGPLHDAACNNALVEAAAANAAQSSQQPKSCGDERQAWIEFSTSKLTVKADDLGSGYDDERYAIYAGVNLLARDDYRLDLVGGYTRGDLATKIMGDGYVETYTAALRASARRSGVIFDAAAGGTLSRMESSRLMATSIAGPNDSDTDGYILHLDAAARYPIALSAATTVTPFVSAHGEYIDAEGFTETGPAQYALTVANTDTTTGLGRAGAEAAHAMTLFGKPSELKARAAWAHDFGGDSLSREAWLHGTAWEVRSTSTGRNLAEFGASWTVDLMSNVKAGVEYQGQFNDRAESHAALIGASLTW